MYEFEPTSEQQMLVEAVERYAANDMRPAAREADEAEEVPEPLIDKGWALGLLQAAMPEEYGGLGERSAVTGALAAEALGWGDLGLALALITPATFAVPILLGGSQEQKEQWLPEVAGERWIPYVAAWIEPRYDFTANELGTRAEADGDGYIVRGEKTYVPFADRAKAMLAYAGFDGCSQAFVVPGGTAGVEVLEREHLMGAKALPCYRVRFNDVRLPASARLGGPAGHEVGPLLAAAQVGMAALAVGLSRAALEYALNYAKDRHAFGVPIAQKQSIAFMLAEMATEIEAIRLLTWEAAWKQDNGAGDAFKNAYLAATGAADMVMMVTDRAVQILGGYGYIREYPVEMWMRNGRGFATLVGLAIL
jgi:alkylation response protein AidB-like acyl-CoA dehydrogenase